MIVEEQGGPLLLPLPCIPLLSCRFDHGNQEQKTIGFSSTIQRHPTVRIQTLFREICEMPRAEKLGSLLFCPDCGTLLNLPQDGESVVACSQCQHEEPVESYNNAGIITHSHPDAFPSLLQQQRKTQTKLHLELDQGTLVAEKCPVCGHLEAYSKELQLRSADEGTTVFYTCVTCKHGWRVNN
ncbi:hypothetical protein BDN72DRAFT_793520 [Pluteus cervinus]|uniref:Uncharacterized protein n=1 Tax=Pluteus cervinus TaxID=181527 RepID=A0ACD3B2C8_9AGAR|nr:hypothetical protein BDN72DRAFT_793520 [Pluteus cervinus]